MYPITKEIIKPSCVTHSCSGKFTAFYGNDLVLIRKNYLQLFNVRKNEMGIEKVKLIYQTILVGEVDSIDTIKIPTNSNNLDYLLISFKDAKLSILEYHLNYNKFITVSIHYYERDELKKNFINNHYKSVIRVDPGQRCVALNFYDTQLAILPMRQKEELFLTEMEQNIQQPYLPSFIIDLAKVEPKLKSVIDTTFLHGYFSPTLAVLYESSVTYSGNPYKPDNISIMVLSLDISHQTYPIIYRMENLPSDSLYLISLPKPTYGFLIINSTSIIYGNQGSNQYNISINTLSSRVSDIEYHKNMSLLITLEKSYYCFINSQEILMSLKNGKLAILYWKLDGKRINFVNLMLIGNSILTNNITKLNQYTLFLGSLFNDSILLKVDLQENMLPPYQSDVFDIIPDFYQQEENEDENEDLNENEKKKKNKNLKKKNPLINVQSQHYKLELLHTFINISPITKLCFGSSEYNWEYEQQDNPTTKLKHNDLVICSGHEPYGSISILHKNLRFKQLLTYSMENCDNLWSLKLNSHSFDQFLIISKQNSTLILKAGNELQQVENTSFFTTGPTIYIGTLKQLNAYIQVYKTGVRIVDGDGKQLFSRTLATNRRTSQWVTWALVTEPYLLLRRGDDSISLFEIQKQLNKIDIISIEDNEEEINIAKIASSFIYKDERNGFKFGNEMEDLNEIYKSKEVIMETIEEVSENFENDEDLYGEKEKDLLQEENLDLEDKEERENELKFNKLKKKSEIKYLLVLLRVSGDLEIYLLPKLTMVYSIKKMDNFNWLFSDDLADEEKHFNLINSHGRNQINIQHQNNSNNNQYQNGFIEEIIEDNNNNNNLQEIENYETKIQEIGIYHFGQDKVFNNIYLILLNDIEEIIIYEILLDYNIINNKENLNNNRLAIKFNRVLLKDVSYKQMNNNNNQLEKEEKKKTNNQNKRRKIENDDEIADTIYSKLRYFENINDYSGILISGEKSKMVINNEHNILQTYNIELDNKLQSIIPFHHRNCEYGLIYFNENNELKLNQMDLNYNFELEWGLIKKEISTTPHFIEYHSISKQYVLIQSNLKDYTKDYENYLKSLNENEEPNPYSLFPPPIMPKVEQFNLQLISPVKWEFIDSYKFELDEHVTDCKIVDMDTQFQARKTFVAITTSFYHGEETSIKGRIYLFDIIEVVPEIDNPFTNHKLKLLIMEEVKGTVSAIHGLNGYLVTCIGSKVIIRSLKEGDSLDGVAFLDVQIYVNTITTIKNFILVGDAYKSIWFIGFQEEPPILKLLGKDFNAVPSISTQFLIYQNNLSFLLNDQGGNTFIMTYSPNDLQSFNGQKLIYQCDINLHKSVNNWIILPFNVEQQTYFNLGGSLDGSIIMILPIDELRFRRLQLLQNSLISNIQNLAGLNTRAYRLISNNYRLKRNPLKGFLDGDLLNQFLNLPISAINNIAAFLGADKQTLLLDLYFVSMAERLWF